MKTTSLGNTAIQVSTIGLGCMGMSQFYGPVDDEQSLETIRAALDLGVNFLDTADFYGAGNALTGAVSPGFGHNEELIGRAIEGRRNEVVVATKFGVQLNNDGTGFILNGHPEYVASACEASLRRLRIETIDLYYAHRVDPNIPVEETVGAMSRLIEEGKVRAIGLSDATSLQLRRADAVHPVSALQSEYSLWERNVEVNILPTCRELGVTFVPYCPLGRSILTGGVNPGTRFSQGDYRANDIRFRQDNVAANMRPIESLARMANQRRLTPAQLALAWLLAQPFEIVPIPGTRQTKYLRENSAAADVSLSLAEITDLNEMFNPAIIAGRRETTP